MQHTYTTRAALVADEPFLWEMLWEAAAVSPEIRGMGRERAFALPDVARYLEDWGRPGDAAVVAVPSDGACLGAAWSRLFPASAPGYGFVAEDIPELGIGVSPQSRGRGIGGAMLEELKVTARAQGYAALSLSVNRGNPARRLYERHGFEDLSISAPTDSSVTLLCRL